MTLSTAQNSSTVDECLSGKLYPEIETSSLPSFEASPMVASVG